MVAVVGCDLGESPGRDSAGVDSVDTSLRVVGTLKTRARWAGAGTALLTTVGLAVTGVAVPPASAAAALTIDAPVAPTAGTVVLTGKVGPGAQGVTSVMYVLDASGSTRAYEGSDCSGNGAAGVEDDFNGDGKVGDVLDCEIAGVLALNNSVPASGTQVGLVALAATADRADVDPSPAVSASFVPPTFTGGDPRPLIENVARSVTRQRIGLYEERLLGEVGTNFNEATDVALSTLASAPAGPKWIMFLADGQAHVDDAVLERLRDSGVRLRSFGIGQSASCDASESLSKLAAATGESCEVVPNPASLAASLTGARPDSVNGVTVTINGVSVAANLDALGGWKANFTLGAGQYTATARAVLASGATVSTQRTFTVAAGAGGPAAGSVTPGPGSLEATAIRVKKPGPTRKALPASVSGRVGRFTSRFEVTDKLKGAAVVLQARAADGAPWKAVDRDKADSRGKFELKWRVRKSMSMLRVVLDPHAGYAGSVAAVPAPAISDCKVIKRGGGWTLSCSTTAKSGSRVRLLKNGTAASSSRVKDGTFKLRGSGRVGAYTVDVTAGKRHIRLEL